MNHTPAAAALSIALIDTKNRQHTPTLEDWYIHVDGICYGYLNHCDKPSGYAVGIGKPDGEIKYFSIESSKDAAIAYAEKHVALLLQSSAERRRRENAVNFARASVALEGFKCHEEDEELYRRFVAGEISISDVTKTVHESVRKLLKR